MIIYYGIDIEWIKKVFYLPSEEWMISLVVVFFQIEYFIKYQGIYFNQRTCSRRSLGINVYRGRVLTLTAPSKWFPEQLHLVVWGKNEKKTPTSATSAVTVKIKPKSSRLSVQEKGFSIMNSVQTKLDWLPGSKFVRFEMVEESKIVWYIYKKFTIFREPWNFGSCVKHQVDVRVSIFYCWRFSQKT